jgi:ketosteroid isomerase-like protein
MRPRNPFLVWTHWRRIVAAATVVGAIVGAQGLYRAVVRALVRRAIFSLRSGDVKPLLQLMAKDVRFIFPGTGSFAADYNDRRQVKQWLERFVQVGFDPEIHEIIVSGPLWRTMLCVQLTERLFSADGTLAYANQAIIFGRSSWGRVRYQAVYEDTETSRRFDDWLAVNRPQLAPAASQA